MLDKFKEYLELEGKSENTIKGYTLNLNQYLRWYKETYSNIFNKLYKSNVNDYISYLKSKELNYKTINNKLSSLITFNLFLIDAGLQDDIVVTKKDLLKIQSTIASPTTINQKQVEAFRQQVLEDRGLRDYTIVTILSYAGLRISECLDLTIKDIDLDKRVIYVVEGKGNKYREVLMSNKVYNALQEYLKELKEDQIYLFISNRGNKLDRTVVNRMFNKYSDEITPHSLRHYYCTIALEKGLKLHEVANQAGHSNINTTMQYTNPTMEEMKNKIADL